MANIITSVLTFSARLMIVSLLLKSGIEIVLYNKDTPSLIVNRMHTLLRFIGQYFYIDQDVVLRFTM
jgi:hypothetical protein